MDRKLIDWNRIAADVFMTVFIAAVTGGKPALGITENGGLIFAVGI
jgi:hypothetical protein